jgi:hypothetical protein
MRWRGAVRVAGEARSTLAVQPVGYGRMMAGKSLSGRFEAILASDVLGRRLAPARERSLRERVVTSARITRGRADQRSHLAIRPS